MSEIQAILAMAIRHDLLEWTLPTDLVAEGYGVDSAVIRNHKKRHAAELIEGKHFISVTNRDANPRAGIPRVSTHWTKKGVVRLGFFIRSKKAAEFRDLAEDWIINCKPILPENYGEALRELADTYDQKMALEAKVLQDAPKVTFYDQVAESDTVCQMGVAAQVAGLPFGRNILYQRLRADGILISAGERHNLPYQKYITEQKYFVVKESSVSHPKSGDPIVTFSTRVTQKGIDFLIRRYGSQETLELPQLEEESK